MTKIREECSIKFCLLREPEDLGEGIALFNKHRVFKGEAVFGR